MRDQLPDRWMTSGEILHIGYPEERIGTDVDRSIAPRASFTATGHKAQVEPERNRVVCLECPWFKWMPGSTPDEMKAAGWRHRDATKLR